MIKRHIITVSDVNTMMSLLAFVNWSTFPHKLSANDQDIIDRIALMRKQEAAGFDVRFDLVRK